MSSRKVLPVKLSPKARQDFIDILQYTGETWGEPQLLIYRNKINDALQALGQDAQLAPATAVTICPQASMPIWSARMSSSTASSPRASASCASCISA